MDILFALLSSLFIGINAVIVKKVLHRTTPFFTAVVFTLVGMVFFWFIALLILPNNLILYSIKADVYFIISGFFAPALARWFLFTSIERVGVSVSSSILATVPAFASILAILFLGEQLSLNLAFGVILIISGIIVFERDKNNNQSVKNFNSRDLLLPFIAALSAAVAITIRKMGLQELNSPVLGAAWGFSSAMVTYLVILLFSSKQRNLFIFRLEDSFLFITGGLSLAVGWLCIFYALSHGRVLLVAPLIGLHPLVVLILSPFFLKDFEQITLKTVLGCASVLLGVSLITLW